MPHSVPVSKLMIPRREWPQLTADPDVVTAIKILRTVTEDQQLEHGYSTPLVFDDEFNLVGFLHLIDLLKSVRHVWGKTASPATAAHTSRILSLEECIVFAATEMPMIFDQ